MRGYAIKLHNNSVGTKIIIHNNNTIIFSRVIIYDTFKFHLNNLGNLNFIKDYIMLSMINTTSTLTLVYENELINQ